MSQLTELQIQANAARVIADLVDAAVHNGAKKSPTWSVSESGMVYGTFHFDGPPKVAEMDAWRLVIGAHAVESIPFQHDGWHKADTTHVTFHGMTVSLTVTYPYTPVGLGVEAVAA